MPISGNNVYEIHQQFIETFKVIPYVRQENMKKLKELGSDNGQMILPIKTLQALPKNKTYKLLDVGGGTHILKDFLPSNIEYASLDVEGNQDFVHNLDHFPLIVDDQQYDIINCLETLEHCSYPSDVMSEILRIAKPDAMFFVSIPNEYNFYCRLNYLFGRKTSVNEPFMVVKNHHHIQLPRVKDTLNFLYNYIQIEQVDYRWYSRHGGQNKNFVGGIFRVMDGIINFMAQIWPSLFARTVVVRGKRR